MNSRSLVPALILSGAMALPALAQGTGGRFSLSDFTSPVASADLADNALFTPPADAAPALAPFTGTLTLTETAMPTTPESFSSHDVLGKDPQLFPGVSLTFLTVGDDLVPTTQQVIRNGTTDQGNSFWDVIVQPGKVWSLPGDDGWSRASFPFSLVNMLEGETHNGVAMFLYRDGEVTPLRYQILTETAPFYIEDYFTAAGSVPAIHTFTDVEGGDAVATTWMAALADAEPMHPWSELEQKVGAEALAGFDSDIRPEELLLDGLVVDDSFYLRGCPTPAGPLPYCDRQRFGIWSVTKSVGAAAAMLSIAQKYGDGIFDEKIADYLPQAAGMAGWDQVTFGDMLNMASGMGYGQREAEPLSVYSPYSDAYYAFYEAPSMKEKVAIALDAAKPYDWGPGQVVRYRDEDMFLLGAALSGYLNARGDEITNVWDFLQANVYQPIGIHYAPTNRTIEPDGAKGQPLMAWGFYASAGDLVKLARLYQNGGVHEGQQIFSPTAMADIRVTDQPVGLPTGLADKPSYGKAFWRHEVAQDECTVYFPSMDGWGANHVMLMPNDISAIRIAGNWDGDESATDLSSIITVADRIAPFCE